jgi:hypothetical protein
MDLRSSEISDHPLFQRYLRSLWNPEARTLMTQTKWICEDLRSAIIPFFCVICVRFGIQKRER